MMLGSLFQTGFSWSVVMSLRIRRAVDVVIENLESRRLLSTPASPRSETLSWLNRDLRAELQARLSNMPATPYATLQSKLPASGSAVGAWDDYLLTYMTSSSTRPFYFDDSETASRAAYAVAHVNTTGTIDSSDDVVDNDLYNVGGEVIITGNVNFMSPPANNVPEFIHNLNRLSFMQDLAESYRYTGLSKYADELRYTLADWSDEFRTMDTPSAWSSTDQSGWRLDTAIRSEHLLWSYQLMLGSSAWTSKDNTLALYKLVQHADYLYSESFTQSVLDDIQSNRVLILAKGLFLIGTALPEFDNAAGWVARGRELLALTAQAQIYADGSHIEQSPGYQITILEDLLDTYELDKQLGNQALWDSQIVDLMGAAFESYRQFLSPDGRRPGVGDTYRTHAVTSFLPTALTLGTVNVRTATVVGFYGPGDLSFQVSDATQFDVGDYVNAADKSEVFRVTGVNTATNTLAIARAQAGTSALSLNDGVTLYNLGQTPVAKPRTAEVWVFGETVLEPFLNLPATPEGLLGNRGRSFAMPYSGNYIVRSDDTETATQLIFDAGAKGGIHGHYDPLNFELWSGGRPLVIDPGPYKYEDSPDRDYVLSTRAHNTISVNSTNTGSFEDPDGTGPLTSPAISSSYDFGVSAARLSGIHYGYQHIDGQPVINRQIWYDYDGVLILVDFVDGSRPNTYTQSFNLPASAEANTTGVSGNTFKTRYTTGDNVSFKIINGGTVARGGVTFVTGEPTGDYKDDAYRFTVVKSADFAVFVTLIQTYTGLSVPNVDANVIAGGTTRDTDVIVRLTRNGVTDQDIVFAAPAITRIESEPSYDLANASVSDIAHDAAGNLHMVYMDLTDWHLRYTVRDASTGKWSVVSTIDNSSPYLGTYLDMTLDSNGNPGVAYFDGNAGDLKYAYLHPETNNWEVERIDSKKSVGLYPSLMYTRSNSPIIAYYHRSDGDLRIATGNGNYQWTIETFATAGDQGRFPVIKLDPNRTDLNGRYVIGWENTTAATYQYAFLDGTWKIETIDTGMSIAGGYLSIDFYDTGSGINNGPGANNWRYMPVASYYESMPDSSLKFAKRSKLGVWTVERIDGAGPSKRSGLYSQVRVRPDGREEVFFRDHKANLFKRITRQPDTSWSAVVIDTGGRSIAVSVFGSTLFVTNLIEETGRSRIYALDANL